VDVATTTFSRCALRIIEEFICAECFVYYWAEIIIIFGVSLLAKLRASATSQLIADSEQKQV